MALAADPSLNAKSVAIYGVAQKDSAENIRRFLGAKGDPYAKVGLDADGRAGIDWGVYGVPETFIVRGDGSLAFKLVGPMTAQTLESEDQAANSEGDELGQDPIRKVREDKCDGDQRPRGLSSQIAGLVSSEPR